MSALTLYDEEQYDKALERACEYSDEIWERDTQYFENFGDTMVHKAAAAAADGTEQLKLLEELLKLQPDTAMDTTNLGLLPIHLAGISQNLRGAQLLHDVYPDGVKRRIMGGIHIGGTALHVAVYYADFHTRPDRMLHLVHFLVEKYPEALLMRNTCGWTPLDICILLHGGSFDGKSIELISYLRDKTALLLPHGAEVIRVADALEITNREDGVTTGKITIVMHQAGCSQHQAIWALGKCEADLMGAVFETRTEEDFARGVI